MANSLISIWNFCFEHSDINKPLNFNNKFLLLGSPKLDTIYELPNKDYPLPQDWQNKIYDENGNKKTITLYSTILKTLFSDIDIWFKNLETIINFFKNIHGF